MSILLILDCELFYSKATTDNKSAMVDFIKRKPSLESLNIHLEINKHEFNKYNMYVCLFLIVNLDDLP